MHYLGSNICVNASYKYQWFVGEIEWCTHIRHFCCGLKTGAHNNI